MYSKNYVFLFTLLALQGYCLDVARNDAMSFLQEPIAEDTTTAFIQQSFELETFGQEMTDKIANSVEVGTISVEEGLLQIGDLEEAEYLTTEQANLAENQVEAAEVEYLNSQEITDLSEEAVVQVYSDVENNELSPMGAYDLIDQLMEDGIVQPADGLVAMDDFINME